MKPWEKEEFINFLNDMNEIATEYGWNIVGHNFSDEDLLKLLLSPAIGSDSSNRKF